jgi:hypothetical protein
MVWNGMGWDGWEIGVSIVGTVPTSARPTPFYSHNDVI